MIIVEFGVKVLGIVCLFLVIHPYTTYPVSLLLAKRWFKQRQMTGLDGRGDLSVEIVFCAHNEESTIQPKMENLIDLMDVDPNLQIRVYLDGCTDGTSKAIAPYIGPRFHITESKEQAGKSRGMNSLLADSQADIVIFTDANVILDKEVVNVAKEAFRTGNLGCLCGHLIYTNANESQTASLGARYWQIEEWMKDLESQTGSVMGADGSLFAIRRSLFNKVPEDIIDDFYTSMGTLFQGFEIKRHDDFKAYERSATKSKDEFRRKVRIACRAFNCQREMWPQIRRLTVWNQYKYFSHKFLRWIAAYLFAVGVVALGFVAFAAGIGLNYFAAVSFVAACLFLATKIRIKVLSVLGELALMYIATAVGVWQSIRGQRYQSWKVVASSR